MASLDRVALITGASSGIGEASACALAAEGFRVVLAARRGDRLEATAKRIEAAGGTALPLAVDLAEADATATLVPRTLEAFGRVDVLVNNAGFSPGAALEQHTREEIAHIFHVNLFSALQLAGEVAPVMRAQGEGRILNVGSMGGHVAAPLAVAYGASKSGLDIATRSLRLELAPFGIHVSLIVPGFVDTEVFENARQGSQHLRDDPGNPYRKLFFDLDEFAMKHLKKALSPEDLAHVVLRAATERRPKLRYYAPVSGGFQATFLGMLPEAWVHRILIGLYKIGAGAPRVQ